MGAGRTGRVGPPLMPNPDLCSCTRQGDYTRGHDEQLPYSDSSMRSMYHIRDFEVYRMMQVGAECRLGLPSIDARARGGLFPCSLCPVAAP